MSKTLILLKYALYIYYPNLTIFETPKFAVYFRLFEVIILVFFVVTCGVKMVCVAVMVILHIQTKVFDYITVYWS